MKYRVREPTLTIRSEYQKHSLFATIPEGAYIVVEGTPNKAGLIRVVYQDKAFSAFWRDIRNRCELVQAVSE